jgi:crotonobetainyl-CoA:carnitine CoA-transferase CaiB-like acyl-CoA transferase
MTTKERAEMPSSDETATTGPLSGITVVDLTLNIAGPSATLILRDLGARVIKIESPTGDDSRQWPPFVDGLSTTYATFNRGKETIGLDLKTADGRRLARALIARADVFVESLRPGKATALGLDADTLLEENPALVYCSVNAFGSTGPLAGAPGFDAIIQAYSGILDLTGHPDAEPSRVGTAVIDVGTGMWAAMGVMAALIERERTGRGARVEQTLLGTATAFLMHHLAAVRLSGVAPRRLGTAQHNFAPYQVIRTRGGSILVGVNSDRMWLRFCQAIGDPGRLAADERFATNNARMANRGELISAIELLTQPQATDQLSAALADAGIPSSPVRTVAELAEDPQLDELGLWGATDEGLDLIRFPVGRPGAGMGAAATTPGQTSLVLRELGLSLSEIDALEAAGIVTELSAQVRDRHDGDR